MVIFAVECQKLLVIALFHDLALAQQNNVICVLDGGKTVGNDEHSADIFHPMHFSVSDLSDREHL